MMTIMMMWEVAVEGSESGIGGAGHMAELTRNGMMSPHLTKKEG